MRLEIDAWLERPDPRLRVRDADMRQASVLLEITGPEIEAVLDRIGCSPCDLMDPDPQAAEHMAERLLAGVPGRR